MGKEFQTTGEQQTETRARDLCTIYLISPGLESQLDREPNAKTVEFRTKRNLPMALENIKKTDNSKGSWAPRLCFSFPKLLEVFFGPTTATKSVNDKNSIK